MSETCTGHDLPYSCVRTCAMHVQAALCLAAVFVLARCMYRPRSALQLCSYLRDACTGRALPYSCVRTCAVHVRATLCLSTVLAYARHARSALCPADARRVLHTHGISACARKRARGGGHAKTHVAAVLTGYENAHVAAVLTGFCHGLRAPFPAASTLAFLSSQPQTVVGPTLVWTSERDRLHGSDAVMCVFVSTNC
jgi:hypothetical protein